MSIAEDWNELITLAPITVGQTVVEVFQTTAWLALTANQQNRLVGGLMSIETAAVRLGDANTSATQGALLPSGLLMDFPKKAGSLKMYAPSGTATINITLGLR